MSANEYKQLLEEFERKRKMRQITVSFDDEEVRKNLRHIDEPITLFGEGPADRRERLRNLLAKLGQDSIKRKRVEEERVVDDKDRDTTTWYHPGPEILKDARYYIADYSIRRVRDRLRDALEYQNTAEAARTAELYKKLAGFEIQCSQIGDTRPISSCIFSPDESLISTSSWSGLCKIWNLESFECERTLRGHNDKVCSIVFHPESTISQTPSSLNLVSSSFNGEVYLWSLDCDQPLGNLEGIEPNRVYRVSFHPCGRFIATSCIDKSWRLWDLEANDEVLYQEGHTKAVLDVDFHPDGSLAASASDDTFGRIWDLRTGRCIMLMDGHQCGILSISFSPNGYQLATGSLDHSVKIWDLRAQSVEYTIPAHNNIVSKVVFEKKHGSYLITSSYDKTIKLWAYPNWTPIQTLKGHDNKVMCVDVARDSGCLITSSFDRTFKYWSS